MIKVYSVVLLASLILTGAGWSCARTTKPPSEGTAPELGENSKALRKMFLELTPEKAGIILPTDLRVWGGAMDWSTQDVTVTVISLMDGNASIYIRDGGIVVGGVDHESVRKAAQAFVESLETCASDFKPGPIQDFPSTDQIRLYALSRSGLLHSEVISVADPEALNPSLASCHMAAQGVITEMRLVTQKKPQI